MIIFRQTAISAKINIKISNDVFVYNWLKILSITLPKAAKYNNKATTIKAQKGAGTDNGNDQVEHRSKNSFFPYFRWFLSDNESDNMINSILEYNRFY